MKLSSSQIKSFQKKILTFYSDFGRDLPWRKTTDPYKIWVSEIMLQQTQVDRVVDYFNRWMKKWPTVKSLACADRTEVLKMWMGLGYNNRAIRLHDGAKLVLDAYSGDVIAAMKDYRNVKGIGPYTSAAVQIFSKNTDIVTVDTNIRRILIHEFGLDEKMNDKQLWEVASTCLPKGKSRDWHNGLMDYGATFLTARKSGVKSKSRQSKFAGSDRQIRGKILRHLLAQQKASFSSLMQVAFGKEQQKSLVESKESSKDRLIRILEKMEKDKVLKKTSRAYILHK